MAGVEAVVRTTDMQKDMQQDAVDCAAYALQRFSEQKSIAQFIKKEFDEKYNAKWHVVVGHDFASYVTHEVKDFTYFFIGQLAFLIWRTHPNDFRVVKISESGRVVTKDASND
ncbi:Dynein light chain LC6 [Diplonema papillatum]|nr:Dynein light chain LC6 [Diplonema papillatum]